MVSGNQRGVARAGEGLLAGQSRLDRRVECLADAGNRIGRQFLGQPGELLVGALDLLVHEAHRVVDLDDLRAALALAEEGVLRRALGLLHELALLGERRFGRDIGAPALFQPLARIACSMVSPCNSPTFCAIR